jgi:DNA-directed RNA polymerase subunit RPC12/RpoP
MAACPHCNSNNLRRTVTGAVYDTYRCSACTETFTRMNSTTKRMGIIGLISVATCGLDFGILGGLAAGSLFGDDSDSSS